MTRIFPLLGLALLLTARIASADWDFLYRDATGNCVTRSQDPFAIPGRSYRLQPLPASWAFIGDSWISKVDYAGEMWFCRDGTILPPGARPKVVSKLDLLLVLREMDKLTAFAAWLDASGLKPFWDAAQLLTTDHPLYEEALASVQEALGITDEERDAILERIAK